MAPSSIDRPDSPFLVLWTETRHGILSLQQQRSVMLVLCQHRWGEGSFALLAHDLVLAILRRVSVWVV